MARKRAKPTEAAKAAIGAVTPPEATPPANALVPQLLGPAPSPAARAERLRQIVANPPPRPSVNAFLDHWFAISGGPAQFALDLRQEFDAAEPGSLVRSQIIQLIVRSMKVADTKEGALDELGLITDDDLERRLKDIGDRLLDQAAAANPPTPPE